MSERYKMVPVEPTWEMERAAESYWNDRRFKGLSDDCRTWAGVYQSMLVAAPSPDVADLMELLAEARYYVISSTELVRGGFIDEIDTAIEAYREQRGDLCSRGK